MSNQSAVTMQDLELEHAELLPSRETLCAPCYHPCAPCGPCLSLHVDICLNLCL